MRGGASTRAEGGRPDGVDNRLAMAGLGRRNGGGGAAAAWRGGLGLGGGGGGGGGDGLTGRARDKGRVAGSKRACVESVVVGECGMVRGLRGWPRVRKLEGRGER